MVPPDNRCARKHTACATKGVAGRRRGPTRSGRERSGGGGGGLLVGEATIDRRAHEVAATARDLNVGVADGLAQDQSRAGLAFDTVVGGCVTRRHPSAGGLGQRCLQQERGHRRTGDGPDVGTARQHGTAGRNRLPQRGPQNFPKGWKARKSSSSSPLDGRATTPALAGGAYTPTQRAYRASASDTFRRDASRLSTVTRVVGCARTCCGVIRRASARRCSARSWSPRAA